MSAYVLWASSSCFPHIIIYEPQRNGSIWVKRNVWSVLISSFTWSERDKCVNTFGLVAGGKCGTSKWFSVTRAWDSWDGRDSGPMPSPETFSYTQLWAAGKLWKPGRLTHILTVVLQSLPGFMDRELEKSKREASWLVWMRGRCSREMYRRTRFS